MDLQYELEDNRISKGKKIKEIFDEEIDEYLNILVDNKKIYSNELEDDIYYKYIDVSDIEEGMEVNYVNFHIIYLNLKLLKTRTLIIFNNINGLQKESLRLSFFNYI